MMRWLLHVDDPRDGAYNMAKDEYCLRQAMRLQTPVLRVYQWDRLTMSVGRAQKLHREVDAVACARDGVPVVRRMTGGRAVLHGTDLTYSVAAPTGGPFAGDVLQVYRAIARVFVLFLQRLGQAPTWQAYTGRQRAQQASAICFATPAPFEILIGRHKLIGSAQRVQPGGFLQHGSIPLHPQHDVLARLFRDGEADALRAQMTDLETLGVWRRFSLPEVQQRLLDAAATTFDARFDPAPWGAEDEAAVRRLCGHYAPLPLQMDGEGAPTERATVP